MRKYFHPSDWSDPSSPTDVAAQAISDADKIADGFVPYYESLFARKHPEPAALRKWVYPPGPPPRARQNTSSCASSNAVSSLCTFIT